MKLRFTTRRLLVLVILVGLSFAGYFEVVNRRDRDEVARRETVMRREVAYHTREAMYCRGPVTTTSYDPESRTEQMLSDTGQSFNPSRGWEDEARLHDHWIAARTTFALEAELAKLAYQRRLLWPF